MIEGEEALYSSRFFGVDGHRLEMDADQRCELDAVLLLVGLQVGRRLEVVGVEILVAEGEIELHKISEPSHLQVNTFLFKLRLGCRRAAPAAADGKAVKARTPAAAAPAKDFREKTDMDRLREAVR